MSATARVPVSPSPPVWAVRDPANQELRKSKMSWTAKEPLWLKSAKQQGVVVDPPALQVLPPVVM